MVSSLSQSVNNGSLGFSVFDQLSYSNNSLPLGNVLSADRVREMSLSIPVHWLWLGKNVKLVDGFTFTMPDTPENQKEFPQSNTQTPGVGFPIARDDKTFVYRLEYIDENGKRKRISLGHADERKAESQRKPTERELRMGIAEPTSMRLSKLLQGDLTRSRGQVRQSTLRERDTAMRHLIKVVGDIDSRNVKQMHGERFIQARLECGDSRSTTNKKVAATKRVFQLAVQRGLVEENPFRYLRKVRISQQNIRIYIADECDLLIRAARERT